MYSWQNIKLILINSKDLPFRHALNKEMLLLKRNRVIFKKKAFEKLVTSVTYVSEMKNRKNAWFINFEAL